MPCSAAYADSAPIMSVIGMMDCRVTEAAEMAAQKISGPISELAAACFGIYIILIMVNYMRGGSSSPVWDVVLRAAGFAIIICLGLNYDNYVHYVMPIIQQTGDELANYISGSAGDANALDELTIHYLKVIEEGHKKATSLIFPASLPPMMLFGFKFLLILIGLVPFLVLAAALLVIAKVGVALIAAVGPIFFAFAIFPATRQYFSAWLNSAFSYALIPIFVAMIAMISVQISMEVFQPGTGGMGNMSLVAVFKGTLVNLLLLLLLKTVSALASSLSAGGINAGSPTGGAAGGIRALARSPVGTAMGWAGGKAAAGAGKTAAWGGAKTREGVEWAKQKLLGNGIRPG
jgi:type IV secretion system protein VirB6